MKIFLRKKIQLAASKEYVRLFYSFGIKGKCIFAFLFTVFFTNLSNGQTTLYTTDFGAIANVNPVGWTFTGVDMNISTNTTSSGYPGFSGGAYLGEGNSVAFTNTFGTAEPSSQLGTSTATLLVNTTGYSAITLSFGMRKSSAGYNANATYSLEWSTDNITYNAISYTEATAGSWGLASGSGLTLPAGADNQPALYVKWTFNRTGTASNYKIDDFKVSGNSLIVNSPPTIVMDVISTTNYIDGGATISPASPFGVSGVINDPTNPANLYGINFTINDAETPLGSLIVTAVSSNTSVVPNVNVILSGSGVSRNVKITPVSVGYSNITVTVNDGTISASYIIYYASSIASTTPTNTFWHTGMSDGSDAIALDDNFFISGDDELNVLNVYSRSASGLPFVSYDYTSSLALPDPTKPEVDLEAATNSPGYANRTYWLGSMSNGKGPSFSNKPNRNRIFATTTSGTGATTNFSFVGYYGNLRAELISWGDANGYNFTASAAAGVDSKTVGGFAAEGMVFGPDNTTLYIGMRAPLVPTATRTNAVIAPILNFEAWFNGGTPAGSPTFAAPIELNLGGRGLRDLIRLSNGTYIIVAGNPAASPITSAIYKWTGNSADAPILISTTADGVLNMEGVMQVNISGFLSLNNLQVITDGGSEILYGDGFEAKDIVDLNLRKFRSDNLNSLDLCLPKTGDTAAIACSTFTWYGTSYSSTSSPTHLFMTASGCDSIVTLNLTINTLPSNAVTAGGPLTFCAGNSVTFNTAAGSTYQWSLNGTNISGATSNSYTATAPGNYSVVITNPSTGCANTSAIQTVIVNPLPVATITTGGPTTFCQGDSVLLSAPIGAASYQWIFNSSNISGAIAMTYTALNQGTYEVTVNDGTCSNTSAITAVTVNPLPVVPVITQVGTTLTSTVEASYQWYLNGTPIIGATSQSYTFTANGSYTVEVTTASGCSEMSAPTVITTTEIATLALPNSINIYPNPYNDNTNILVNIFESSTVSIEVYNILGEKVQSLVNSDLAAGAYRYKFSAKQIGYSSGIYFVRVNINDRASITKIIEN